MSFIGCCERIRASHPSGKEKCRKPIWWGARCFSLKPPDPLHLLPAAANLDLPHQLHSPGHLDEDLLLEVKWTVKLGSGQTRLPRRKRAGVREACAPTCTLPAPSPTSEPTGPDLSLAGQPLQILTIAGHRRVLGVMRWGPRLVQSREGGRWPLLLLLLLLKARTWPPSPFRGIPVHPHWPLAGSEITEPHRTRPSSLPSHTSVPALGAHSHQPECPSFPRAPATYHLHIPLMCDGPLAVRPRHPNHGLQGGHVVVVDRGLNPHLGQRTWDSRALNAGPPSRGNAHWLRPEGLLFARRRARTARPRSLPLRAACASLPSPRANLRGDRLTPQGEGRAPPSPLHVPTELCGPSRTGVCLSRGCMLHEGSSWGSFCRRLPAA